jgi:hypothetical protein
MTGQTVNLDWSDLTVDVLTNIYLYGTLTTRPLLDRIRAADNPGINTVILEATVSSPALDLRLRGVTTRMFRHERGALSGHACVAPQ